MCVLLLLLLLLLLESNYNLCNVVTQYKFLTKLQDRLKDPQQANIVLEEINQLRSEITKPTNFKIFISGDITKVTNSINPWSPFPSLPINVTPRYMYMYMLLY